MIPIVEEAVGIGYHCTLILNMSLSVWHLFLEKKTKFNSVWLRYRLHTLEACSPKNPGPPPNIHDTGKSEIDYSFPLITLILV